MSRKKITVGNLKTVSFRGKTRKRLQRTERADAKTIFTWSKGPANL